MIDYRAYTVGPDGHFVRHRAFKCADDTEALTWAKQLFDGYPIELWSGQRFIARVDQNRSAEPAN